MASLKEIIQDLAQGDDSELLVMSFDIGTTRCEWPIRISRATPTEVYLFVSRLECLHRTQGARMVSPPSVGRPEQVG
jgi:hypothetical protein